MSPPERPERPEIIPRFEAQGYTEEAIAARRRWLAAKTGADLTHVGAFTMAGEAMRGNIENPVGAVQVPLGIAGPLLVHGEHARGTFYVPLATTEGTLVRSYERGAAAITRAGGATVRLYADENRVSPVFLFDSVADAADFVRTLPGRFEAVRAAAESTTRHGRLLRLEPHPVGREVMVHFCYATGDALGMNMIVKATEQACQWLLANTAARRHLIYSGLEGEKRAAGSLFAGGKGKKAVAGALLPARVCRAWLHATPEQIMDVWHHTVLGHLQGGTLGYNGHIATALAALFIACGQDVASVANAAVGVTAFEVTAEGDLHASVTLPSLTVATVGGGTGLGTARECLEVLGCSGDASRGGAAKLAEIAAALVLAGELSMAGAVASGEIVQAHEAYGRNRPPEAPETPETPA